MDKYFHTLLYSHTFNGCNYLSIPGLKLICFSKRGPGNACYDHKNNRTQTTCYLPALVTCVWPLYLITFSVVREFTYIRCSGKLQCSFSMMWKQRCNGWLIRADGYTWWRHQMGNIFRVTGHLCGEFTGYRWIPRTKASDAVFWSFLWSASE